MGYNNSNYTACLTVDPVLANIVVVDIAFGIPAGAASVAGLLLVGCLVVLRPRLKALRSAIVSPATTADRGLLVWCGRLAVLAVGFGLILFAMRGRYPTPISGAWLVADGQGRLGALEKVFFEHGRGRHLAVFRDSAGRHTRRHFELQDDGRLRIWADWMSKESLIFDGVWHTNTIRLREPGSPGTAAILVRDAASR